MARKRSLDEHSWKLLLAIVIALALAIISMVWAYGSNKAHPGNMPASLALSLGSLVFVGAAYTLASEFFLKRDFVKQLRISIDERLEQTRLNETISGLGLSSVHETFELAQLWRRIEGANAVLIVAMRDSSLFRMYYDQIRQRIANANAKFTVILLNPDGRVIPSVVRKFSDYDEVKLRDSLRDSINTFLKSYIYDKLPGEKKANLVLRLYDDLPVYSAYLFDDEELWYIPYHFRHDYKLIPVFVLKGKEQVRQTEIYKDLSALSSEPALSTVCDLSKGVKLGQT